MQIRRGNRFICFVTLTQLPYEKGGLMIFCDHNLQPCAILSFSGFWKRNFSYYDILGFNTAQNSRRIGHFGETCCFFLQGCSRREEMWNVLLPVIHIDSNLHELLSVRWLFVTAQAEVRRVHTFSLCLSYNYLTSHFYSIRPLWRNNPHRH